MNDRGGARWRVDGAGVPEGGDFFFVSYSRTDDAYVARLIAFLGEQGVSAWHDREIPTGQRWQTVLRHCIEVCAGVVVVMSAAASASRWVAMEVSHAKLAGKPIFGLRLSEEPLPEVAGSLQIEDVRGQRMPSGPLLAYLRGSLTRRVPLRYAAGVVPDAAHCFQLRPVADRIDTELSGSGSVILMGGSARILSGLGGVGKTQLAAAVARRARNNAEVAILLWIIATSRTNVVAAYAAAGQRLAGADGDDVDAAAARFLEYLGNTRERWLIVLDDLGDPSALEGLWPPRTATGRVMVTTRRTDAALSTHGDVVPIDVFTPAEAHRFLVEKLAGHPSRGTDADVAGVAADLGYLPLALAQAAAYIVDLGITCEGYRRRFADRRRTMADLAPGSLPDDYRLPVAVSLSLSVDVADALRPVGVARPLLAALSVLDPNGLPVELLSTPAVLEHLAQHRSPAAPAAAAVDGDDARDALAALTRLSLAGAGAGRVTVHGLVQRSVRELTDAGTLADVIRADAQGLLDIWPEIERDPVLSQTLRDNTAALRRHGEDHLWQREAHPLLFRAGASLDTAGLAGAAVEYWGRLAARCTDLLGGDHPDTLTSRNDLANAYRSAGQLQRAIELSEQTLADRVRVLGNDHPDTLRSRNSLAMAYRSAGQLQRAIELCEQTLADRTRVLGEDDPYTLGSRNNLASVYMSAGRLQQAIALYEQTLADRMRILGEDHPNTLTSRNNLAIAYAATGRLDEAITLYEQTLADRTRILGEDHPNTLNSRNNLANAYAATGRLDEAITLHEQTVADMVRVLGSDHPVTLGSRNNLAYTYSSAGQPDRAVALHEAVLADRVRVLGPDHPAILYSRANLAGALASAGRTEQAIALYDATLADSMRLLGPGNVLTTTLASELAALRGPA
ncbi:FxSxx-COOH system tetratricopeptide repeat protein [Dactylosporangium sp. NPDC049525]|uniref:FxSxx-COOH system tetratricopeptide repeat protein n=1 Tax=Dactylosporangium sp. NPDC049525 TaxID=3154730 RepID=UPI003418CAE2